jgi:hypothetical protein
MYLIFQSYSYEVIRKGVIKRNIKRGPRRANQALT